MNRTLPFLLTFIVGFTIVIATFSPPLDRLAVDTAVFFSIIAVFAMILGGGNLVKINLVKITRRQRDWQFAIVTLVGFFFVLIIGLFKVGNPGGVTGQVDAPGTPFFDVYTYVFVPVGATMYSLLAFFIASASYRAFRAKNREATILLIAASIIMLGATPFGTMLTAWIPDSLDIFEVPNLHFFLMSSPNLAGQRAIMIGIALGVISYSLRVLLGVERSHIGKDGG